MEICFFNEHEYRMIYPITAHLQFPSNASVSPFPLFYIFMHPRICIYERTISTLQVSSVGEKLFVLILKHF